jgi:hypothetical protein
MTDLARLAATIEAHGIRLASNSIADGAGHFISASTIAASAHCFAVAAALRGIAQ